MDMKRVSFKAESMTREKFDHIVNQLQIWEGDHWYACGSIKIDDYSYTNYTVARFLYKYMHPDVDITDKEPINTCCSEDQLCMNPLHLYYLPAIIARIWYWLL